MRTASASSCIRSSALSRRAWLAACSLGVAALGSLGCERRKPVLVYVDSCHKGYPPSDEVRAGVEGALATADLQLDVIYLDAKRNPRALPQSAHNAVEHIRRRKPDAVMVSGDSAMAHLIAPYLLNGPTPVLFCAVNTNAESYEIPNRYVTGMLEVPPVEETIRLALEQCPDAKRLFVLSGDSPAERKNQEFLRPLYWKAGLSATYGLVPDFDHWKKAFKWANENADLIFFITNTAIHGWDHQQALTHIRQTLRVPVFTCDEQMIPYCVVGRVNVAREQGEWVAAQALRILQGLSPADIPLARNQQSRVVGNPEFADLIGFELPEKTSA